MLLEPVSQAQTDNAALETVLKLAEDVESIAVQYGLLKRSSPLETKKLFHSLDLNRKAEILRDLSNTRAILTKMQLNSGLTESRSNEIKHLTSFLSMMNLKLSDDKFYDYIEDGDMIEVYDSRAIQIYRNWAFFKYCPYSLLELLVNDWNTLFVRPSWVIDRLIEMTPALFAPNATTVQYDLPEYLISARLQKNSKGLLFKMKYVSPLLDAESGFPTAFVTTGFMRPVPETETGRNIDFI
jgi:hypothetical protein